MANDVTIGIPVYRAEQYIANTLNSALNQTYSNIDFLVIDDCSDDRSLEIIQDFQQHHPRGKNIRIIHHEHNQGIGNTRNHLIDEAKTKYFFFLDADDTISENAIQLLHAHAEQYQAELVYGSHELIRFNNNVPTTTPKLYENRKFLKPNEFSFYVYYLFKGIQAPVWNILINLKWFRQTKLRFLPINYWEDFSLTLDLPCYSNRVVLLSTITYRYNIHMGSLSNTETKNEIMKTYIEKIIGSIEHVKNNSDKIKEKPCFPGRMAKVMVIDFYLICYILKNKHIIRPSFSNRELRNIMKSPLTFKETFFLKNKRIKNIFFYLLGVLPPFLSIYLIKTCNYYIRLIKSDNNLVQ